MQRQNRNEAEEGDRMRSLQYFLTFIMTVVFAGSGLAVPPGKTIDYEGGIAGKVIFNGKIHGD
jgi:hypothetical protein